MIWSIYLLTNKTVIMFSGLGHPKSQEVHGENPIDTE